MALVDIVRVELIEEMRSALGQIFVQVVVPHHAHAAGTPSTAVVGPGAVLGLTACRIGGAGLPEVLVETMFAVHEHMVRGLMELCRIAGVVGAARGVAPVVARGDDFQMGFLGTLGKLEVHLRHGLRVGIITEVILAEPDGLHVTVEVIGCAFLHVEGQDGVEAPVLPDFVVHLKLDQALQDGGIVGDVDVVVALHTERRTVAEQLHPLATVVLDAHITDMVVWIAVAVDALMVVMCVDGGKGTHMGRQGIFAAGNLAWGTDDEVTVHGHDVNIVEVVGNSEAVSDGGRLAAALGNTGRHVEVTERSGFPHGKPITIVGVVGISGLQLYGLSVHIAMHVFKLDDVAVLDVGTQHQHHRLQFGHIDVEAFVGSADGDFGREVVGVDHLESAVHSRCGLPLRAVARLDGTDFHDAFLTCQGDGVTLKCGGTFHQLEANRQSRGGGGVEFKRRVEDEFVGDGVKFDELRGQSGGDVSHHNIVEATV